MKRGWNLICVQDNHIWRQHAVQCGLDALERQGIERGKIGHLLKRVNACIRAPGADGADMVPHQRFQAGLQCSLDRALVGLNLPALEICTVVFQSKPNIPLHSSWIGMKSRGHREWRPLTDRFPQKYSISTG